MKKAISLLLAGAMGVSLCACGSSSDSTTTTTTTDSSGTTSTTATEVVAKDSAIVATAGEPYRFFAQGSRSCGGDDNLVLSNIYDCLLRLEGDGSLSPGLAESYTVSEDGLCYTFELRSGVTFHNGEPLTAEDVKFTFDTGAAGPIGPALFVNYESCEIVDEDTVNIYLSSPYAAFPYGVASRIGGIVCESYYNEVGEDGYMAAPIGTGAYKFVEYVSGSHTTLVANEDYWRGEPDITNITIQTVSDTNTQVLGLQNGDYDAIINPSIDICLRFDDVDNVSWGKVNSTGRITLYLAAWAGPAADTNFRKAVQAGINKDDVNAAMFSGEAETLIVDLCRHYGGYPTSGLDSVDYDKDAAIAYLADSSYNGEEFAILVTSGSVLETASKVVQAQLMEIGINCVVDAVDNLTYSEGQVSRDYDAIMIDNLSSLVDADGIITLHRLDYWDASVIYPRDEELNALFMQGRAAQGEDRYQYYIEGCNIITAEAYDVPLVNGIVTIAYNAGMTGVSAHCLGTCYYGDWSWGA